jgi:tetratricopeptide (TPR) repeat protein
MIRPKTKRRLTTLLIAGAAAITALSMLVVYRLHRYEQGRLAYRAAGMQAFQTGDYRTAADDLSRYLSNDRVDPPAIYCLAVCRTRTPRPDLGNLLDARRLFSRYLELKNDDLDAQHQLLEIDQKLNFPTDTLSLAETLLQKNPDDVAALSAKLQQLDRAQQYADALPVSLRLNELKPLDLRTQITTLGLMSNLHRPPGDIIARADGLVAAHPGDPRFQMVRAAAAYFISDVTDTKKWLHTAAVPEPQSDYALLLAGEFDKLEMWSDGQAVLARAAAQPDAPPEIKAALAQRFFEFDQLDAALAVLHEANPAYPAADPHELGLKGLVRFAQNHERPDPQLTAFDNALQARADLTAIAWDSLLRAVSLGKSDPLAAVHLCQIAAHVDLDNADARYFLGRAYDNIGESELALQRLHQAALMQSEWALPRAAMARILLDRGQAGDALANADAAFARNPQSTIVRTIRVMAAYAALRPNAGPSLMQPLLDEMQHLRDGGCADPQLLAAQVDLLARDAQRSAAIYLATRALASDATISPQSLLNLQEIDRVDHLDLSAAILARAGTIKPDAAQPSLALVRVLIACGKRDSASDLTTTIAAHPGDDWALASTQAREALADPQAAAAWKSLVDTRPGNIEIQLAALHSTIVSSDRQLLDRVIDHLRTLTGEESIEWKLARARWQLTSGEDQKNNANSAAAAMAEVVRIAPQYAMPQIIWADALSKLGDLQGATQHLRLAQRIDPTSPVISLKLANVLLSQGQTTEAVTLLNSATTSSALTSAQRLESARLFRQAGLIDAAIGLLKDDAPIHPDDPQRDLLLAELLARNGNPSAAADIYEALMTQPATSVAVVRAVAWSTAEYGQIDRARQYLARLNDLPLALGEKETIAGEFEASFGSDTAAAAQFQAAVKASPKSTKPWLAWAGFDLRRRDFSSAVKLLNDAIKQVPNDPSLLALQVRARTLAGLVLEADMQPLIDGLSLDPANEAATATLAAIADSQTAHESADQLCDRLAAIVTQFPRYTPALTLLVNRDCAAGHYDRPRKLATHAGDLSATDPEPARLLAMIESAGGNWEAALTAAARWRERSLDHPRNADVAIASSELQLHHPDQAREQIATYITNAAALAADEHGSGAITVELYLKSLYLLHRADEAAAIAQPLAAKSPDWKRRWLRIVSTCASDTAEGSAWIRQIEPLLSPTSIDDQLSRGQAWCTLGTRLQDATSLQTALDIAEPLTDAQPVPADAWLLLGNIHEQLNQLPEAQAAFAKALQTAPDSAIAKNDLAMATWLAGGDLHTAQQLAAAAIAANPINSAMHSTLGEIDQQLNDWSAAQSQFETAVNLDAQNIEAMIGLAAVKSHAGKPDLSLQTRIDAMLKTGGAVLPVPVKKEWDAMNR